MSINRIGKTAAILSCGGGMSAGTMIDTSETFVNISNILYVRHDCISIT